MNDVLVTRSYAKVNITLDVLRRREDGYHEVKMIMQTVSLYDKISVRKQKQGIRMRVNLPYLPVDSRNLAYQAAQLFFEKTKIAGGAEIRIEKHIPVAAGLAGGSGNAAAVLCALNELYHTGLPQEQLAKIGLEIGADVPYCIYGGTMLAEGIGEKLTKLPPLPVCYILLVKPKISVSTKKVYEALDMKQVTEHPDTNGVIQALHQKNVTEVSIRMFNVLQQVTEQMHPEIMEIRSKFMENGAEGTIMSGSGPTVFGIFEEETAAKRAYQNMRQNYPETFLTKSISGFGD